MQPTTTIYGAHEDIAPGSSMSGTYNAPQYNAATYNTNSYAPPVTPGNPSAGVNTGNTPPQQQDNATYLQNLYNSNPTAIKKAMNDPHSKKYYTGPSLSSAEIKEYDAKLELKKHQDKQEAEANKVTQAINDIRMGVMPLSAGEQAQVSALEQSFGQLINQQKLRNIASENMGNIRGYQTGAAEYDPTFQAKTIGTLVSAGLGQISNLNIQMAGAVAKLKQSFQEDDLEAVREAWDIYETTSAKRAETLQKTINDAQAEIVAAQEAQAAQEKAYYEQVTKPINEIAKAAAEGGATPEQLAAISSAENVNDAVAAAGGSLMKFLPGDLGKYQMYVRQAIAAGQVPVDFQTYEEDAQERQIERELRLASGKKAIAGTGSGGSGITVDPSIEFDTSDPFIQKLLSTKGGKALTDTSIQKLDKGLTVLGQLGVLQANIDGMSTGPILGAFRSKNPWDSKAQIIKNQLNAIVPNLARGVYGEVGVLTDNDIRIYSQTIPNLQSTQEVRDAVLYITLDMIGKSITNTLSVNASAGRDVSNFVDIYAEMQNTKNSILQSIPGALVPESIKGGSGLLSQGQQAKTAIDTYFDSAPPEVQGRIEAMYASGKFSDEEIYQQLKTRGLIK